MILYQHYFTRKKSSKRTSLPSIPPAHEEEISPVPTYNEEEVFCIKKLITNIFIKLACPLHVLLSCFLLYHKVQVN